MPDVTAMRIAMQGCSQENLDQELSGISIQVKADALNRLLQKARIQLFHEKNALVYKEVAVEDAAKFRGLTAEDIMLYQVIKAAGNSGVFCRLVLVFLLVPHVSCAPSSSRSNGQVELQDFRMFPLRRIVDEGYEGPN